MIFYIIKNLEFEMFSVFSLDMWNIQGAIVYRYIVLFNFEFTGVNKLLNLFPILQRLKYICLSKESIAMLKQRSKMRNEMGS